MSHKLLAILLLMAPLSAWAAPKSIKTCVDDRPWLPYTNPNPKNPGTMQVAMQTVAKKIGVKIIDKALPWKRCQEAVRDGDIDAMIGAGYVDFNREFSDFPMVGTSTGPAIDSSRSLGSARVMLARKQGSKADFDGKAFSNVSKAVGVAAGTQVMILEVQKFGKVDDGAKTDEQNMQKLLDGRIDLMAAYAFDLKLLIDSKFKGKVEILPVPLIETFYYLAFSKKFTAANKDFVEKVWNEIGTLK